MYVDHSAALCTHYNFLFKTSGLNVSKLGTV